MVKCIYAHRGLHRDDENGANSILAVNNLEKSNYEVGVEFDIQLTKDDQIVIYHDKDMKRLHELPFVINQVNYDKIGHVVPLLFPILEQFTIKPININIEIKIHDDSMDKKIKLVQLLKSHKKYLYTSFDDDIINILLQEGFPNVGYLFKSVDCFSKIYNWMDEGLSHLSVRKDICLKVINNIKFKDMIVLIYTFCNNEGHNEDDDLYLSELKDKNVGIITDDFYKISSFLIKSSST